MALPRLRRDQQVERNREELLAAARRVFLARGFHAASLDAIAEAAGFSKGVVYSQFQSKADLFLALLEQRIEERAAENERVAARSREGRGVAELLALGDRTTAAEPAWGLLLIEFRVHAARHPALNQRYARLHARTVERLASTLGLVARRADADHPRSSETMALFVLALASGLTLEGATSPNGLPSDEIRSMAVRAMGADVVRAGSGKEAATKRRAARRPDARRGGRES